MKKILLIIPLILGLAACETADDISNKLDHQVPDCKTLTLSSAGESVAINDNVISLLLWGVVPQNNLESITLPTLSVAKNSTLHLSVTLSDNVALKTVQLDYSPWLYSKYINFQNPEGDVPLTPKSYTLTADVVIPNNAVTTSWLEDFYFNDGSSMKIKQSYHKFTLTVTDVNMNKRLVYIYIKAI